MWQHSMTITDTVPVHLQLLPICVSGPSVILKDRADNICVLIETNVFFTSQPLLDRVMKCESISFPESPMRWVMILVESDVAAVLECFVVQLTLSS